MADEQIPRLADLLAPGIDGLVAHRPNAGRHIARGRYGAAVEGLSAQAALVRARLASECASARLELAELGLPLYELVAEYGALVDPNPTHALGEALLLREVTNNTGATTGNFGSVGVIQQGHRFRRPADENAQPSRLEATYSTIEPVLVDDTDSSTLSLGGGSFLHRQAIFLPIIADRVGTEANTVLIDGQVNGAHLPGIAVDALFDPAFTVDRLSAAGGSTGPTRAALIQYAKAAYSGQYGPTDAALIAGAFSFGGVSHVALELDAETALARLWIADASWGGDRRFASEVFNHIVQDWLGFGASARVSFVTNVIISMRATVFLTSPEHGLAATEINANIREKVAAYFDERPDWWTWKLSTLRGVIARSDRRILTCTEAEVFGTDGAAVPEPRGTINGHPIHYMLSGKPLGITLRAPQ